LPFEVFLKIISSDSLNVTTEKTVCEFVAAYIQLRKDLPEGAEEDDPAESDSNGEGKKAKKDEDDDDDEGKDKKNKKDKKDKKDKNSKKHKDSVDKDEEPSDKPVKVGEDKTIVRQNILRKLTQEQENILINQIRFSFLSHLDLIVTSQDKLFDSHKNFILEALSIRLNSYENVMIGKTKLNLTPRTSYAPNSKANKEGITNTTNNKEQQIREIQTPLLNEQYNPVSSYDDITYQRNQLLRSSQVVSPGNRFPNTNTSHNLISPKQFNPFNYKSGAELEFNYSYDFDENGIFYYLATRGRTAGFRNPAEAGLIRIFSSALIQGNVTDLISRRFVDVQTTNQKDSFFGFDFGEGSFIVPSCYTIRNSSSFVVLTWIFQGSNDLVNFDTLDTGVFLSSEFRKVLNVIFDLISRILAQVQLGKSITLVRMDIDIL
jgi:hypothetical protein